MALIETYSISTHVTSGKVDARRLTKEIQDSSDITKALDLMGKAVYTKGDLLEIHFLESLPASQKTPFLDNIVQNTSGEPLRAPTETKIINPLDGDEAPLTRVKQATKGYTYQARAVEFTTSLGGSLVNENPIDDSDWGDVTLKFYDALGAEIPDVHPWGGYNTWQDQLDVKAVKTVVDFMPAYDFDLIGGFLEFDPKPTTDVRVSCIGVPDFPVQAGGSKVMISNINAKHLPDGTVTVDGRVTKHMMYNGGIGTNKLRKIIKHPVGEKHLIQIVWEHFKA